MKKKEQFPCLARRARSMYVKNVAALRSNLFVILTRKKYH